MRKKLTSGVSFFFSDNVYQLILVENILKSCSKLLYREINFIAAKSKSSKDHPLLIKNVPF